MNPDGDGAPKKTRFGETFGWAVVGAALGCLAVIVVSLILGVWIVFLAFPLIIIWLVLSALFASLAIASFARLWFRRLSTGAIVAVSAVLTFVLFSALPLYFALFVPGRAGGLLFG
jgi:hypothetical protein